MKTYFTCMMICCLLFSCKKDTDLKQVKAIIKAKKYPVTFNVSDFVPKVVGASKGNLVSDVPLTGRAEYFTYFAYDSQGKEVSRIKQDSTGESTRFLDPTGNDPVFYSIGKQTFGCIKDTLAAGQYTIVMLASQADYSISSRNDDFELEFQPLSEASFYYRRGLDSWSRAKDTFFKKFTVSIEEKDSQHQVSLDRIVGKAEINILDSKPGTIFRFLFLKENEAFKFSDEQPFGNTDDLNQENDLPAIAGKEKLSYSKFLINTASAVDVIINVYENGILSATKTIKDVRFYKNKRTILTGNIYSGSSSSTGFSVKVNDEFDKDSIEVSF